MTDFVSPFWREHGGWDHTEPALVVRMYKGRRRLDADTRRQFVSMYHDMVEYTRLVRDPKTRAAAPEYMGGAD